MLHYNKADLILGAGDTDELARPYMDQFKTLGYNVLGQSDYENDPLII